MIETIIKGWDKIGITKTFLLTFQLVTMEINTATPLFKEPTNEKVVEEANIDIDLTNAMLTIVENCLYPTPPTTCVRPSRLKQKMCAQARKKKIPTPKGMKSISMSPPTCVTTDVNFKKACAIIMVDPK